jgi:hypothetical protein
LGVASWCIIIWWCFSNLLLISVSGQDVAQAVTNTESSDFIQYHVCIYLHSWISAGSNMKAGHQSVRTQK